MDSLVIHSYEHNKRGPRKDKGFYKSLVELYARKPEKVKDIINVLPKIGYYKDFFFILEVSGDASLNDYIYSLIINLMNQWSEDKYLILAKWLPREKTSFDRKFDFVNKISQKLFPKDKHNDRKQKYRKLVAETAKKLNILETNLCAKTYDSIQDVTENNLKTYEKLFTKNLLLRQRLEEILDHRYKEYSMIQLITEYEIKTVHKIRAPLIEKYLQIKKSEETYPVDCLLILDINGGMFNNNSAELYARILVYSSNHTELIINGVTPRLITFEKNLSMQDVKSMIDSNLSYCDRINIRKIISLAKKKYNNYTIVSGKCRELKSKQDVYWDIIDSSFSKKRRDIQILKDILDDKIIYKYHIRINLYTLLFFILLIIYT